tara:strand:- start:254 stop:1624 length:1371 start_codon:yes stop_codon:yes gene_type:complete
MPDKYGKILVVDDDKDVLLSSRVVLKPIVELIRTESDPHKLPTLLRKDEYDLILLDMNFSTGSNTGNEGIHWLKEIIKFNADQNVIMITAFGEINLAIDAMKNGAIDFIVKPWDNEKLIATVSSALRLSQSKKEIKHLKKKQGHLSEIANKSFNEMIGDSAAMQKVHDAISKVTGTDANVLITGENGTGKELVARSIHNNSKRAEQIFVNVDMGAISESLFESELFGHKKGAFTDAHQERIGRFEVADQGSLFLDEIGNLSLQMQAKLLRVLESREIVKIGENTPTPIDIRLISATNSNLREAISKGDFREDLLYRLNTIEIHLPALRERQEDIPLLLEFFLRRYCNKYQKPIKTIADATLKKLMQYNWPGNIRELKHMVERSVIMSNEDILKPNDFPINIEASESSIVTTLNLEEIEKDAIIKALRNHDGNISKASKELGMGRTTLYRRMTKYGI